MSSIINRFKSSYKKSYGNRVKWLCVFLVLSIFALVGTAYIPGNVGALTELIPVLLIIGLLFMIIVYGIKSVVQDKKDADKLSEEDNKRLQELSDKIHKDINEGTCAYIDDVDISLPKDEHCLASYNVAVYKDKYVSQKVGYSGLSYRIKIAKGLSYRVGTINPSISREKITYIDDQGTIYLTNERMIIKLSKKVDSIKYSKILSIEMIPGGVIIYKDSGAPKVFNFKSEFETFPIYVDALINKSNS